MTNQKENRVVVIYNAVFVRSEADNSSLQYFTLFANGWYMAICMQIACAQKKRSRFISQPLDFLAPQQGLEPWTPWLTVRCSNQLSYWGIFCGMLRERLCRISVLRVQIYIKIFILPKVLAKKWRKRSDESSEPCTGSRRFSPGERRVAPCRTDKNKKETGAATSWYR